ncbi:hypothetical protein CCAL9344_03365 [Campylobacter sp. RM9344]|uniref:Tetratricopeptide repeat protein n=1 Tax=Campylobacter californiensis TaxID=1032243 RepID=A0AAW3ZUD0_9BACT|nr:MULTISPECIES: hypothetical protein [unclassified Campylobacter]MBE2985069.1 hypothetical protein [Campylobacter sp. RM6883]MBE2986596.1 hypothetical protein [Campylobacter sp. RM12919]MBE2987609.1 hypothetical protein [Campylobacter sp. RM12920]MBE2995606.1 hypothetical protein [Campylobacter sp. RM6913]MBE3022269.1 hypothetical protein [Campylobacter sp. 7477a]MBE3029232.1 hypothetical protein [Campylobacter sp. RM9344]
MKNTVTEALIYEAQGLKDDALEIYKNILKNDANNKEALAAIRRLSGLRKGRKIQNELMKDFFIDMNTPEEITEFKRWLIRI